MIQSLVASSALSFTLGLRMRRIKLRLRDIGLSVAADGSFSTVSELAVGHAARLALMRAALALKCRFSSGSSIGRTTGAARPGRGDDSLAAASMPPPVDADAAVERRAWSNSLRKIVRTLSSFLADTSTIDDWMPFASAHSSVFSIAMSRLDTRSHCRQIHLTRHLLSIIFTFTRFVLARRK